MLFLYGRPGVGKTALARELALKLKSRYPDGQLIPKLGLAGGRRPERDILSDFLLELGWPENELRGRDDLDKIFRAVTAKRRMLIVLDAARDAHQVEAVLPGGDRCAVIVTSRANHAGPEDVTYHVKTPTHDDAALIMRAYLENDARPGRDSETPSADLIAEACNLCGYQAVALKAVGEKARDRPGGLHEVVSSLRDPRDRLHRLANNATDPAERIASEYDRLSPRMQLALQALTLVSSSSFVPWVLQPLLQASLLESANIMAALSEVGLLDEVEGDPADFPRYGFSPLIKLFAEGKLRNTLASDKARATPLPEAKSNLRLGLLMLAKRVNERLEPHTNFGPDPDFPSGWIPLIADWEEQVATNPSFWIREEFPNLIEVVHEAHRRELWTLAWKLSAQLIDCEVTHVLTNGDRKAFREAREDAERAGNQPEAAGLVLLAEGSSLLAAERYTDAIAVLNSAVEAAEPLGLTEVCMRASRLIGQAEQRLGKYLAAGKYLRAALDYFQQSPEGSQPAELASEARITEALLAENALYVDPLRWPASQPHVSGLCNGQMSFTEHLIAARVAHRRMDLRALQRELEQASATIGRDASLAFELQCEEMSYALSNGHISRSRRAALIARAANVATLSRSANAWISNAEARILLARALLANHQPEDCLRTLDATQLNQRPAEQAPRLRALELRLRGEAHAALKAYSDAEHFLLASAEEFGSIKDFWSQAEAYVALGSAQRKDGRRHEAQLSLLSAAGTFRRCGDGRSLDGALALLMRPALILSVRAACARLRWFARSIV